MDLEYLSRLLVVVQHTDALVEQVYFHNYIELSLILKCYLTEPNKKTG